MNIFLLWSFFYYSTPSSRQLTSQFTRQNLKVYAWWNVPESTSKFAILEYENICIFFFFHFMPVLLYGTFWRISLEHFIKHKPLISEGWEASLIVIVLLCHKKSRSLVNKRCDWGSTKNSVKIKTQKKRNLPNAWCVKNEKMAP